MATINFYLNTRATGYDKPAPLKISIRHRNQQINYFIDIQREMVSEILEQGKRNDKERERVDKLIDKIMERQYGVIWFY